MRVSERDRLVAPVLELFQVHPLALHQDWVVRLAADSQGVDCPEVETQAVECREDFRVLEIPVVYCLAAEY